MFNYCKITFQLRIGFLAIFIFRIIISNAQSTGKTTVGNNGNGSTLAPCTEILRFDNYNDAIASSGPGQDFIFTLLNGYTLSFNLKKTGVVVKAVTAPCFSEAPFGLNGYTGLSGNTVLYEAQHSGIATFVFSNFVLKDIGGNAVTNFTIIAFDAETTDSTESITLVTDNASSWFAWDSILPVSSPNSVPIETGIGTDSVVWSANPPFGTPLARSIAVNSPIKISVSLNGGIPELDGVQAMALGIKRIIVAPNDTICSNGTAVINPINASAGTTYTWAAPVISPAGSISGASAQATGVTTISQSLSNNTNAVATAAYTITPTSCGLIGNSFTATVVINPNLNAGPDQTLCNSSATMAATGTGAWSAIANNPAATTIVTPTNNNTFITGLTASGVYQFVWANNQCTDTVAITVSGKPTISIASKSDCAGQSVVLTATGVPPGGNYNWSQGSKIDSIVVSPKVTTLYFVSYGDSSCSATDSSVVAGNLNSSPDSVKITPSIDTLNLGKSVTLTSTFHAADSSHVTYSWLPPDGLSCIDCPNPVATPLATTTYILTFEDSAGCIAMDSAVIIVSDSHSLYIPNAFTPNGDGKNDIFKVYGSGISKIDLKIFDRWGELVFQTTDPNKGWDGTLRGKLMMPGEFVYEVTVTYFDTSQTTEKGSLLLLR